jgi:NADPH:quinone reductase-like Zn-dependent oxidoreductase
VITSLRGTGGYAERAVAPADALIDVPDDVTLPDAVALRPTLGKTLLVVR